MLRRLRDGTLLAAPRKIRFALRAYACFFVCTARCVPAPHFFYASMN